jgi:hypothetical protein
MSVASLLGISVGTWSVEWKDSLLTAHSTHKHSHYKTENNSSQVSLLCWPVWVTQWQRSNHQCTIWQLLAQLNGTVSQTSETNSAYPERVYVPQDLPQLIGCAIKWSRWQWPPKAWVPLIVCYHNNKYVYNDYIFFPTKIHCLFSTDGELS